MDNKYFKKKSKILTSGQGFINELKRIKQKTKTKNIKEVKSN